tara:strand:- start:4259 stop:5281 length:1023 start_codon:yes stop_codon:yes gene_type:complete
MKKYLLISLLILLYSCDKEDIDVQTQISTELIFVANEGNFGTSNGSVSVIKDGMVIQTVSNIGDVVQSLLVDQDKLFVAVNNSHKINIYDITEDGLLLPGIEIDTNGSSPREMTIVDNRLYFTNWNSQDVKILNLFTYDFETPIKVDGLPESIVNNEENIFVGIMMNEDYSDASTVLKISHQTNNIVSNFEVGKGPTSLLVEEDELIVARTFYDENWNSSYGTSRVVIKEDNKTSLNPVTIVDYGAGVVCGGSVHSFRKSYYRSYLGGVAKLNEDLSINENSLIGFADNSYTYSVETINDKVYIGTLNGYVKILSEDGLELNTLKVGEFPGDFEYWSSIK